MNEMFKNIEGYEGMYMVSNMGNVKSLKGKSEKIMKPQMCTNGYTMVCLRKDGKGKFILVHILVAKAFVDNPDNLPEVNHKYGIKTDNRASELEWTTHSNNIKHSYYTLNRKKSRAQLGRSGYDHHRSKEVRCINTGKVYGSISVAAKDIGGHVANISKVLHGKAHHCKGLKWEFA